MHKYSFCQKFLDTALTNSIHAKRKACLTRFLSDLLDYDTTLSTTEIGKKLTSKASVKSKIKAANYFATNYKLADQIAVIYNRLAAFFWGKASNLIILVDWTGACNEEYFILKASVAAHGRSIPIYHEIHPKAHQEQESIHNQFLYNLKEVVPEHLSVTIVTDAGFHRNWFDKVIELGWDCIGRIYSLYQYQLEGQSQWSKVKEIPFNGFERPLALGKIKLGKTKKPLEGYLYTYKQRLSGKVRKKKNKYPSHDKAHSESYKNGWVIFSSMNKPARLLVRYYKKRMQIEQNFKDIKNEQLGFGLRRNLSSGKTQMNMLFFLATLLIIICWWFGLMMESLNLHRAYQANTVKNKRVRSFIHLARLGFRHQPELLCWDYFQNIIGDLQQQYHQFIECRALN